MTKVVTFGAFVEIMPGVEGLVHISELAQHHVENPREVVSQGDLVRAKIIEVDAERRRLSLSLKRVEGDAVQQRADDAEAVEGTPNLDLSEEVFPEASAPVAEAGAEQPEGSEPTELPAAEPEPAEVAEAEAAEEPEAVAEAEPLAEEPEAAADAEPSAVEEPEAQPEPAAEAEPPAEEPE